MAREYIVMRLGKGKKKIELCLERRIRKYGYAGLIISNLLTFSIGIITHNKTFVVNQPATAKCLIY